MQANHGAMVLQIEMEHEKTLEQQEDASFCCLISGDSSSVAAAAAVSWQRLEGLAEAQVAESVMQLIEVSQDPVSSSLGI